MTFRAIFFFRRKGTNERGWERIFAIGKNKAIHIIQAAPSKGKDLFHTEVMVSSRLLIKLNILDKTRKAT